MDASIAWQLPRPDRAQLDHQEKGDVMTEGQTEGCVASAKGPVMPNAAATKTDSQQPGQGKDARMQTMVGKEAPNFEASAYHEGGFKNIKLSDFMGKWVFLCFYPGDFTFV
jgi:hypothetical protein